MPPQINARAYCQRLQLIALALIIGQLLFLILAFSIHSSGIVQKPEYNQLISKIGLVIGIVFIAGSVLVSRRPAASLDEYRRRFFTGFVLAEIGTLIGMALFFLIGNTTPLVVLAVTAAVSIYVNYAAITRRILASRELNPLG